MKPTILSIDILRLLIDKNIYLNLKEIINFLPKHNVTPRAIQKELKKLSDNNRLIIKGQASRTEYAIEELQSNYRQINQCKLGSCVCYL